MLNCSVTGRNHMAIIKSYIRSYLKSVAIFPFTEINFVLDYERGLEENATPFIFQVRTEVCKHCHLYACAYAPYAIAVLWIRRRLHFLELAIQYCLSLLMPLKNKDLIKISLTISAQSLKPVWADSVSCGCGTSVFLLQLFMLHGGTETNTSHFP